jgi:uncharacterized repeat protein (TIGR03803 family)
MKTTTKQNRNWFCAIGLACALAVPIASPALAQITEIVVHNFVFGQGWEPLAGLTGDSAGNLYGTTHSGRPADAGVVYKLDAAGHFTVLYTFTGGDDGRYPQACVIVDSEGNLYGTTFNGGTANVGVVYKVDPAGNETVLHSFAGGPEGDFPVAGVIRDSEGNLYGTTEGRFTPGDYGTVYKLDAAGNYTVLYNFTDGADGASPQAGVTRDSAGKPLWNGGVWRSAEFRCRVQAGRDGQRDGALYFHGLFGWAVPLRRRHPRLGG